MFWMLLFSPATTAKQAMIHQTWNVSSSAHSCVIFYLFLAPSASGSMCLNDNFNLRPECLFGQVSASVTEGEMSQNDTDCFVYCQKWTRAKYDQETFGDIHVLHTHWINLIFKNIHTLMKEWIKASILCSFVATVVAWAMASVLSLSIFVPRHYLGADAIRAQLCHGLFSLSDGFPNGWAIQMETKLESVLSNQVPKQTASRSKKRARLTMWN